MKIKPFDVNLVDMTINSVLAEYGSLEKFKDHLWEELITKIPLLTEHYVYIEIVGEEGEISSVDGYRVSSLELSEQGQGIYSLVCKKDGEEDLRIPFGIGWTILLHVPQYLSATTMYLTDQREVKVVTIRLYITTQKEGDSIIFPSDEGDRVTLKTNLRNEVSSTS